MKYLLILIISTLIFSCNQQPETLFISYEKEKDSVVTEKPTSQIIKVDSVFMIALPSRMSPKEDLNENASLAYAYIEEVESVVKEFYVIVMMDTKEEIASYDLTEPLTLESYSAISVESVLHGYDEYEILSGEPKVEEINEMQMVLHKAEAKLGEVEIYLELGVFEGDYAFYQVLTWTLKSQQNECEDDMKKMLNSFAEMKVIS